MTSKPRSPFQFGFLSSSSAPAAIKPHSKIEKQKSKILPQATAILLLALLPAFVTGVWHPRRPAWQSDEVTLPAARAWGASVLWIDARSDADFARAHIPGALPLNEDRWDELLPAILDQWDPSRKVVVYCSSLSCQTSRDVARRLREQVNLPNVFVLQGGWESWEREHH